MASMTSIRPLQSFGRKSLCDMVRSKSRAVDEQIDTKS